MMSTGSTAVEQLKALIDTAPGPPPILVRRKSRWRWSSQASSPLAMRV